MLDYINEKTGTILMGVFLLSLAVVGFELFVMGNWGLLWWYFVGTATMLVITSAFYHRSVCHPTWTCPDWLRYPLTFVAGGLGLAAAIPWSAVHRQHHRFPDVDGDVHGPQFSFMHNLKIFSHVPNLMYVRDLLRDKLYLAQAKYYLLWGAITIAGFSAIFGFAEWAFVYMTMVIHQVLLLYVGHMKSVPQNNFLALVYSPEIYHDYHHENAMDPKFGPVDLPYWLLIRWFPHKKATGAGADV